VGDHLDARDGARRIHSREETCIQRFGRETGRTLRRTILENSSTVDLKNRMGCFELDISG
jgi:hypothetical protein